MGVGGSSPHGLSIKTVDMTYDASTHRVTRVSEAGIIFQFGPGVGDHSQIRQHGLKIGFRIRRAHGSAEMAFTTGAATSASQPPPPAAQYVSFSENAAATQELRSIFGVDTCSFFFFTREMERWIGFNIPAGSIPPPVSPASADRLFFKITLRRLDTSHVKDCDVVPVVATFGNIPFQQHYALGVSFYTRGPVAGAPTFDAQVLGNS
jgi:hypothetical protein